MPMTRPKASTPDPSGTVQETFIKAWVHERGDRDLDRAFDWKCDDVVIVWFSVDLWW